MAGGGMITVEEAKKILEQNIPRLKQEVIPLKSALGYILAQDIHAPFPLPLWDNSAMDGFALRSEDTQTASAEKPVRLKIVRTIKAGDPLKDLKELGTYRIMTGAMIPKGANTVLAQENADVKQNHLVMDQFMPQRKNIRYRGEEVKKGTLLLHKNSYIHPATLGILSSLGKESIKVFKKPEVALIVSGSELVPVGKKLSPGKIYDSNSWMISSALQMMGIHPSFVKTVKDEPHALKKTIQQSLAQNDVVILTGGVSTGDYDFVKDVLKELNVRSLFWKVLQKPGKPLFFGRKSDKLIFGLPGNPAAVFTCFYEYIYPVLSRMSGFQNASLPRQKAILEKDIQADPSKVLFLKAMTLENHGKTTVIPLQHQSSHMISSLHAANSLILVEPQNRILKKGERVTVDLLPHGNVGCPPLFFKGEMEGLESIRGGHPK